MKTMLEKEPSISISTKRVTVQQSMPPTHGLLFEKLYKHTIKIEINGGPCFLCYHTTDTHSGFLQRLCTPPPPKTPNRNIMNTTFQSPSTTSRDLMYHCFSTQRYKVAIKRFFFHQTQEFHKQFPR